MTADLDDHCAPNKDSMRGQEVFRLKTFFVFRMAAIFSLILLASYVYWSPIATAASRGLLILAEVALILCAIVTGLCGLRLLVRSRGITRRWAACAVAMPAISLWAVFFVPISDLWLEWASVPNRDAYARIAQMAAQTTVTLTATYAGETRSTIVVVQP